MFHALSGSLIAVCTIHSAESFQPCLAVDENMSNASVWICASLRSFRFFSVRSCFGLCLNFVLGAMPRWLGAAVNGNFMTSLTLITSIKLSCRTHVVDCTFMCLLGNLNLLRCLFVLRPVFSSPIRQIYERRESLSLSWRSANTSYWYYNVMQYGQRGHTSQLLTKNYQWTELDVISNSNYVVPRERE